MHFQIIACDLTGDNPTMAQVANMPEVLVQKLSWANAYIVESSRRLLVVTQRELYLRRGRRGRRSRETNYGTYEFQVFEVDLRTNNWIKMNDLGNKTLFVGGNSSICIESDGAYVKPNRIYFMDDYMDTASFFKKSGGEHVRVYNIEDGSIDPYFLGDSCDRLTPSYNLLTSYRVWLECLKSHHMCLGSTAFLIGPAQQISMMFDSARIYATTVYLGCVVIALICAPLYHGSFNLRHWHQQADWRTCDLLAIAAYSYIGILGNAADFYEDGSSSNTLDNNIVKRQMMIAFDMGYVPKLMNSFGNSPCLLEFLLQVLSRNSPSENAGFQVHFLSLESFSFLTEMLEFLVSVLLSTWSSPISVNNGAY
ncbi:hypothetical protein Dsin_012314 [Dipteronia sinensis]|uniref:KIB1-4 beta-propeller domain-containing protein n=1 Tax=Dipteronia sinensis TaxID=43782 RepID=A0AAE0AJ49_9ROSI|nr:hypothetical protein Dsin_012314 [Dipteronia sinensis]